MKFLHIFTALLLGTFINIQAFGLSASIFPPYSSQNPSVHAASTSQISRNWSGYATTSGTFTGVSASWQIPSNSSNQTYGIDATWVGIGGINTDDLIQVGTQTIVQPSGETSYEAFFETLPNASEPVSMAVHKGDIIDASLQETKPNTWNLFIEDKTTSQIRQLAIEYPSSLSSAEWIEEAPSGERDILPLDDFGTVHFSSATTIENGQKTTLQDANAQAMHMGTTMGSILAVTSVVGNDGASFSVSRTNTSAEMDIPFMMHFHRF